MRKLLLSMLIMGTLIPAVKSQDTITEIAVKRIFISKHPQDPENPQFVVYSRNNDFQLGFGGYAKLTAAFDFNGIIDNYDFITYDVPVENTEPGEKRLYFDAHQSRIFAEVLGHMKGKPLRIYIETDFYSDHYYPRLRHAYGQVGSFLIGQTWTTLMDLDATPNTIDFEGPNSAVALRAPMIRYSFGASKPFSMQFALEMPDVSITYRNPYAESYQYVPDLIVSLKVTKKWGHLQLGGVLRTMSYGDTVDREQYHIFGYGGAFSGAFKIGKRNKFMFQGVIGNGISKYVQDISGVGLDAVTEPSKTIPSAMKTVFTGGFYIAYQQFWSQRLNSTFTYGLTHVENIPYYSGEYNIGQYACVNLFWELLPVFSIALEYLWGQRLDHGGFSGNANRINAMAQFSF